ncbi:enoyl-CoA hydratase/isomerase family protein [Spongiibacter taiwanensis]|uniref:enoyl-CoA hydratase/isomerase family protein n=1 Tax=Spongiibacter taiwanensis TaxID=1748242 RepID=UPI00203510D4|nr:enoyl-CoA hydratase/isomerase family protein [Spongiibacter taiwanensis]USA42564.1 enoyl-CoA hydratase/isomerase family protein [Spongiibacter taiwanensis]
MTQSVTVTIQDNIAEVVLSQPDRGNPFDDVFCSELCYAANECSENGAVRSILLRAEGRFFSVGADLKWLGGGESNDMARRLKGATADLHMAIARFARADAPVVIAVHALAAGGSTALTAMADFALASASAKFYAAYNKIGYVSDGSGSYYLPRRVGSRKAAEFFMLNETWDAQTAMANGLVNRVVADEDLLKEARSLAATLAAGPTLTFGEMKRLLMSTWDTSIETQMELEAQAIARCAKTQDSWDAVRAVIGKQPVVFRGK